MVFSGVKCLIIIIMIMKVPLQVTVFAKPISLMAHYMYVHITLYNKIKHYLALLFYELLLFHALLQLFS